MTMARRLPVAPRPYRDELLSSWLGRVACRYGLDAEGLAAALVGGGDERGLPVDDAAPSREFIVALARACAVDPARLSRLTLAERHPGRPEAWFSRQGPAWAPTAPRTPSVCCACFGADRAVGRDDYLRADWLSAERCVCPLDRQLLRDHCPLCRKRLRVDFRLRDGRARAVCRRCGQELAARSARKGEGELVDALLPLQDRIGTILRDAPERRRRLEAALSTLWAPLDDPGAARPALALWIDRSGWRCPTEARHAIGAGFPLGLLPISCRVATLVAFQALFGVEEGGGDAAAREHLARRAAFARRESVSATPRRLPQGTPKTRPRRDYAALARQILAHPDWIAAAALPEKRRGRVMARLMDAALAARLFAEPSAAPGSGAVYRTGAKPVQSTNANSDA